MLKQGILILPGTGRWRAEGVTEGAHGSLRAMLASLAPLHRRSASVPLPVPGRIA
jgi:hypothetical protein